MEMTKMSQKELPRQIQIKIIKFGNLSPNFQIKPNEK
jgi:hypothetical protein